MKKIILLLVFSLALRGAYTQPTKQAPLQEGDAMLDIQLDFQGGEKPVQLADYGGKLVILKFWTTTCVSCFADFPKMEYLQERFGERIKIILVNVRETPVYITEQLALRNRTLPDLPSVIGHDTLKALFPHPYSGYSVWIGGDREIKLMSSVGLNVNSEKIAAVLAGKHPTKLAEPKRYFESPVPLPELLGGKSESGSRYRGMVAGHIAELGTGTGSALGIVDSVNGTVRNTYVNFESRKIIHDAFFPLMAGAWDAMLSGPTQSYYDNQMQLYCRDSTLFSMYYLPYLERTDRAWIKSQLSYEQVLPLGTDEAVAAELMRRDLVNYFLTQGIALDTVTSRIPCLEITMAADKGSGTFAAFTLCGEFYRATKRIPPYIFADIPEGGSREYPHPSWSAESTEEQLKDALAQCGFRVIESERDMPFIRISDIP